MPRWLIGLAAGAVLVSQAGHSQQVSSIQGGVTAPASHVSAPPTDFRLHTSIAIPAVDAPIVAEEGALRHRIASSMIEFYPDEATGFRLSAGTRYFARRNFLRDAQRSTGNLLYAPRGNGFRNARRFNPALTAGYSTPLADDASIGVEAGALIGRAFANAPGPGGHGFGAGEDNHSGALNPIANLVLAARF